MYLKSIVILWVFVASLFADSSFDKSITPSVVYSKTYQLYKEVEQLKEYYKIKDDPSYTDIKIKLLPRHNWQRTYEIFVKINILRQKNNLPMIEPVNMEPTLELDPILVYEQVLRLLKEVEILKLRLGVVERDVTYKLFKNKTPTDVYNLLNIISRNFDLINSKEFTPSFVFAESIRIYEDFDSIFSKLDIHDNTIPPEKTPNALPKDSYKVAIKLLNSIENLEVGVGLKTIDFHTFERKDITPSDVFEITQIVLAELQVVKAYIGLNHTVTRGARTYKNKTPADVKQMLEWMLKKSYLIKSLALKRG